MAGDRREGTSSISLVFLLHSHLCSCCEITNGTFRHLVSLFSIFCSSVYLTIHLNAFYHLLSFRVLFNHLDSRGEKHAGL